MLKVRLGPVRLLILCLFFVSIQQGHAKFFTIPTLENSFQRFGQGKSNFLDPEHFEVLVWNILKSKEESFISEFQSFGHDVDIFMLQEVNLIDDFFRAHDFYSDHTLHFGTSFIKKKLFSSKRVASGTAISTNTTPLSSGMIRTRELEPFVKTPKVVTWMKLPFSYSDKSLFLVNIHGLNMTSNDDFKSQMQACYRLMKDHDGPIIFAGDFNTSDEEKMSHMMNVVNKLGMSSVTFKNDQRKRSRFSKLFIDFTFIRGLNVKSSKVYAELEASDHKAMGMEFSLSHD